MKSTGPDASCSFHRETANFQPPVDRRVLFTKCYTVDVMALVPGAMYLNQGIIVSLFPPTGLKETTF